MMANNSNRKHGIAMIQGTAPPPSHRRSLAICLVLLSTLSHAWKKRTETVHGKSIIAYYASWQMYDRNNLVKPSNLDHSKVTRYNFAFFQTNAHGDIWGTDAYADSFILYGEVDWSWVAGQGEPGYCSWVTAGKPPDCKGHNYKAGVIYQAHAAGVEVYPSIGGWTLSNHFPAMAKNPMARKNFAANCVKLIETYDFDGIDIDWEYPGYAEHYGTPADTQNYSLLLQEIRNALDALGKMTGRVYGLTAALPCGPDLIDNIEIGVVSKILTELNLMTYDLHGTWDKKTGPNAPLYDLVGGTPGLSVHGCVESWKAGGGNPNQINIGLPFYGRSFAGKELTKFGQDNDGTADIMMWLDDEGSPQYYNIANKLSGLTSVRDDQTKTQYAYSTTGFLSYDDERAICDKTEYALDRNLNGYIIWEISGDLMPDLSTPLLDSVNNRLNKLELRCDDVNWSDTKPTSQMVHTPKPTQISQPSLTTLVTTYKPTQTSLPTLNRVAESASPTHSTVQAKPTPSPTKRVGTVHSNDDTTLFYPDFDDSTPFGCRDDGNAPKWITNEMMRSSRADCCSSYFSPELSGRCNSNHPYYPSFENQSCINDGNHPSWMAGDYLEDSKWACCRNAFRDKKMLEKCSGKSL